MATLVSPGVSVSVIDESFYVGAGQGTVPMIFIATREGKPTPDGSGVAPGTLKENANKLYLISSQRELIQTFGLPEFRNVAGAAQNGSVLNEYGLLAAHSYLGLANRAYVMRSDVDLSQLEPLTSPPESDPLDLTYWTRLGSLVPGLFVSVDGSLWTRQPVKLYTGTVTPGVTSASGFQLGDIVMEVNQSGLFKLWKRDVNPTSNTVDWVELDVNYAGPHTDVPPLSGAGETRYWFKTTTPNAGASLDVRLFDAEIGRFVDAGLVRFAENGDDFYTRFFGGQADRVPAGTLAAFHTVPDAPGDPFSLSYELVWHNGGDITLARGPALADADEPITEVGEFRIGGTAVNLQSTLIEGQTVSLSSPSGSGYAVGNTITLNNGDVLLVSDEQGGEVTEFTVQTVNGAAFYGVMLSDTSGNFQFTPGADNLDASEVSLDSIVDDINNTGIAGISAANRNGALELTNSTGQDIVVEYGLDMVFANAEPIIQGGTYSNFVNISQAAPAYVASFDEPSSGPRDGVLWYNPAFEVDILVRGSGQFSNSWVTPESLDNVVFVTPVEPNPDVSQGERPLEDGDIWVNTLFTMEYPSIYRYRTGVRQGWNLVDNTDQTTPDGVLFADARPDPNYAVNPLVGPEGRNNGSTDTLTLLVPDLDPDVPDPLLYPSGMLLWNTRYSSRNVKRWVAEYEVEGEFLGGRWVSESGTALDGSLLTGEAAVRRAVENSLAASIVNNDEIRAESIFYNLIAAPGFPELSDELVALNIDRRETAFILGDTPADLTPDSTSLQAYAQQIVVNSENIAFYYPGAALTTNLDGREVVVPSSHITLRTFAFNDLVSYPWFAPAGFQRGRVNNATQVGYLNSEDEFVPVTLNQGQRDVLYLNNINPIVFAPNRGLTVFGQKTRYPLDSALDRVNVARLINFIRFQAERIAEPFLFEPNDTQTRIAVKDRFDSFLDELVTLRGLFDFLVVVDESNNTPARIDRNELWVDIAISPTKAVEFIYIPIRVRNTGADLTI